MGKESVREWICVCVKLNHFVVQKKLPQHCKSAILQCNFKKWRNKLQWVITSQRSEKPSSNSLQTINAEEGAKKMKPSYTIGGNVNGFSHYGVQHGASLKN